MTQRPPSAEVSLLTGIGAALITYLGFGLTIWAFTNSYAIEAIYVLGVALAVVSWRCIVLTRRVESLSSEIRQADENARIPADVLADLAHVHGLASGLIGLVVNLTQPPRTDTQHHLTYVREEYIVHGDDGTFNYVLAGYNALDTESATLFVKVAGDSPMDVSRIQLTAIDRLNGDAELQVTCIGDRPNSKAYSIEFLSPLQHQEPFEIKVICRWDKTFLRSRIHDYVYFQWGAFAELGIDRLVGRLVCDVAVTDFVLERIQDGNGCASHVSRG